MKLLPLLCLLSPWFGPGSAQEISVVTVAEDEDALLPCSLGSEQKIEKFDWRKVNGEYDKKEVFFYVRGTHYNNGRPGQNEEFKDRISFFEDELKAGNASIKITMTRLEDSGTYTCDLLEPYRQEIHIRLNVDGVLKIRNLNGAARVSKILPVHNENTEMSYECHVEGVPKLEVEWRNSAGKVLAAKHVPESNPLVKHLVKLQVNFTTSDNYTCVATQRAFFHQINYTFPVKIPGKKVDPESSTGLVITAVAVPTLILLFVAPFITRVICGSF